MIRQVVFDMGNVLIEWDPDKIVARLGVTGADAKLLRREVFDCLEWTALDHGTLPADEALARICRRLPARLHEAAARCVRGWWKDELVPIEGVEELIREIDALGYGVYVLSNATSHLHEYLPRLPAHECFRGLIVSADWKLLKPERAIYERLFSLYGLKPEECFFIDDSNYNIEGALNSGMSGAIFHGDMGRIRAKLREAGVPVRS